MLNVIAFDSPAPGGGLKTVTCAEPTLAMSAAVICADNSVTLLTSVILSLPFQRTTEPGAKFVPSTERVNAGPPATAEVGLRNVITGGAKLIINVSAFDKPPTGGGLKTVICAEPPFKMSAAVIVARTSDVETKVVGRS